jgi:hypothetical protein
MIRYLPSGSCRDVPQGDIETAHGARALQDTPSSKLGIEPDIGIATA